MRVRTAASLLTVLVVLAPEPALALGSDKAMFVGGTVGGVPEKTEGVMIVTDPAALEFIGNKGSAKIGIPWKTVETIEYGQRTGRRIKTAIFLSPLALFSKGRKHMITLTYKDAAGADQAAVFELGKDIYRTSLAALKAKTGREIACQDEDAQKQMGGGCKVLAPEPAEDKKK